MNSMKIIFFLMTSMVWLFAQENAAEEYGLFFYGQLLVIVLLLGYIAISKLNIFGKCKQRDDDETTEESKASNQAEITSLEVIEKYRVEMRKINIENQPFRISGLLHILTNKMSDLLKDNRHTIYYDVESEVGRYIIGDNDYIEQVLEILLKNSMDLNTDSEISLKISKSKNMLLVFEVINKKGFMKKAMLKEYNTTKRTRTNLSENLNSFIKAKKIVEVMTGSIEVKSSKFSGTQYSFTIPYYEDKDNKSNQEELKKSLEGKHALFIGKDEYDTKRAQYIFKTFGINIENMKLSDFENKKPDMKKYDMAILRSSDITYAHISFFKNIYEDKKSKFKIIIVHELFESEEKIAFAKPIAHAELYNPTIIGDVEEILYQMFMLQSNAVKGINNMEIFDPKTFALKGSSSITKVNLEKYKGAHIAIVEDSKVDQRIMRNILKINGITLFCMINGAEMIELLEKEEIDLIFSDINMPVMDGLTMTKKIRTMKKWEKIPIVSISSMAFTHEIKEMQVAGMNASISKPIVAEEVYRAVERFLIMTPEIQERRIKTHKNNFHYSKEVLDIDKGLKEAESDEQYQEVLLETMDILKDTIEPFSRMVYDEEYRALGEFAKLALDLYEKIHAPEMIKMFRELSEYVATKQRTYLMEYAFLYRKNWKKLQIEIERYLEDTQN
ncbi:MAG: hypothetical protein DRG09_02520 [Epsilonproteobacteria bacterium]|nr:MAG: hypothetical protein DRG09_02520 [Campylobacterota bacterium]